MALGNNTANIKAVITAEDRASGVLGGFSKNVESLGDRVGNSLMVAAKSFALAGAAATGFAVKSAADFEQTRIGLENMLGSADQARAMLAKVSKFAAETPFEFPELAQATRQLVAFGFSGEEAFKTMKQLGDVSAAIGTPINDLAYLMGTLKAQGRAFTIDIRQFAQRGIPIYEYLAKVLNTDTKALAGLIEEGKVGFPEVQKAFELMTAEGGKFHGTMEKQSKSLAGLFSTLKDNIGLAAREFVGINQMGDVKAGSLFDKLRVGAAELNDQLSKINWSELSSKAMESLNNIANQVINVGRQVAEYLIPKLQALWTTITTQFGPAIAGLVAALGPTVGAGLVWALGLGIDMLNAFMQFITPTLNYLRDNTWIVWTLASAFVAVKTAMFISNAVTAFQTSMAIMNGAMATTTGFAGGLRLALLALTNPVWITLGIAGVAEVVWGIEQIRGALNRLKDKWNDLKANNVPLPNSNISVSGGSDIGLVEQFRRAMGFRAEGGPISAGAPYIVGEKGPEMIIPKQSGVVIPNNKLSKGNTVGGTGNIINFNVNIGMFAGSQMERRDIARQLFRDFQDVAKQYGINPSSLLDSANGAIIR